LAEHQLPGISSLAETPGSVDSENGNRQSGVIRSWVRRYLQAGKIKL
jgi:hypothetical protein